MESLAKFLRKLSKNPWLILKKLLEYYLQESKEEFLKIPWNILGTAGVVLKESVADFLKASILELQVYFRGNTMKIHSRFSWRNFRRNY